MKNIYLFIISIYCFTGVFAQNYEYDDYHPFPYDSVFFELSTPNEEVFGGLMPLVKSDNTDDMLLPINNVAHWVDILKVQGGFGIFPFNVAYKSWLGKVSYANQEIQFVTAFSDTIKIRTDLLVNTSDTCEFKIGLTTVRKLVVHCDGIVEEMDDQVKEYSFSVLDANSNPIDGGFGGFGSTAYDVASFSFRLSKENGILNTPAFYYFPYCEQYEYKDIAENILDQETLNSYKVFHQVPGDEIHSTFEERTSSWSSPKKQTFYKTICVNQEYDELLQRMIRTTDIWILEKYRTGSNTMFDPFVWQTVPSYDQRKDSVYLNDYVDIYKSLPDGFGNNYWDDGYFYNADSTYFEGVNDAYAVYLYNDTVSISHPIDHSDQTKYTRHLGHSYSYYTRHEYVGGQGHTYYTHKPVYTKINGEEWGVPHPHSFLLTLEEEKTKSDFQLIFIGEKSLFRIASDLTFESARIYDINGTFVRYLSDEDLKNDISIIDLADGFYVFMAWDGQKAYTKKFLK